MASSAAVFEKLNLKDQSAIVVLNAPASFEPQLAALRGVEVHRAAKQASRAGFALAFVTKDAEVEALAKSLATALAGDAVLWFAYPKGSSRNYKSEVSRDRSWKAVGRAGYEPVRMISIDDDWTALRFRRAEFIKTMKRDSRHALSKAGKARTAKKR